MNPKRLDWFERNLVFGHRAEMLPFFLERLEGTICRIESKVKGVSDKVLSEKYNGKWSVKQNIGHLLEVDEVSVKRINEMLNGVDVLSPAVFEPKDYNPFPIETLTSMFKKQRQTNLLLYRCLNESDLLKSSTHPRLKTKMTPVDLAWFDAEHDDHHLLKITDIINFNVLKS
ncbi:MAG TPA: DinB family protein [Cyclobacteriaceae bacterium]|nr:DinB family protein [Cyclobacteriaceae bacterium]